MELIRESTWAMTVDGNRVFVGNKTYSEDFVMTQGGIYPLPVDSLEALRKAWIEGSQTNSAHSLPCPLWIIVCDRPFDRRWYEDWQCWAHSQGGGFEHMSLKVGCRSLPFILKERPLSRVLVRPQWRLEREIWRP